MKKQCPDWASSRVLCHWPIMMRFTLAMVAIAALLWATTNTLPAMQAATYHTPIATSTTISHNLLLYLQTLNQVAAAILMRSLSNTKKKHLPRPTMVLHPLIDWHHFWILPVIICKALYNQLPKHRRLACSSLIWSRWQFYFFKRRYWSTQCRG